MSDILIRKATEDDLPAILNLYSQPSMDDGLVMDLDQAQNVFQAIKENANHFIYVATQGVEIVGTFAILVVQMLSHNGDRVGIFEDVVVRTDCQGQGIGKEMMKFATNKCKELNCYKIVLSSGLHREKAHAFYEKIGFEQHGLSFHLKTK